MPNEKDVTTHYPLKSADDGRLVRAFTYHPPQGDQAKRYELLRIRAREFAQLVLELCPDSRERSLALTEIEDAVMHANAAIARNE